MNLSLFELLEGELMTAAGDDVPGDQSEVDRAWETLEAFRYSALSYWMAVTPPLPCKSERARLRPFLERERKLLSHLRGAYFLTQKANLPMHFIRFAAEQEAFRLYGDDHKLNAETGRKESAEVEAELKTLI
jgi:hypothetical protein